MALFGSRIKRLRTEHGHTQDELAKLVGVSRSTISMVERNERRPDDELLETIADIYNVDMDYLYGRQEVENVHRLVSENEYKLILAYRELSQEARVLVDHFVLSQK